MTIHLSGLPGIMGRAARSLLGLAPGGVCQSAEVALGDGALLPHRFTLACDRARGPTHRRSALCCTFRRLAAPGCEPAPCPVESRPSSNCAFRTVPHAAECPSSPVRGHPADSPQALRLVAAAECSISSGACDAAPRDPAASAVVAAPCPPARLPELPAMPPAALPGGGPAARPHRQSRNDG